VKILVTGGAGFIGSHVVDAYVAAGHAVTVVDDLSTGKRENLNPKARFVKADIGAPALRELFRRGRFDVVNHHAAQIDVRRSVADPLNDARINVLGLIHVLELARAHGVKKMIFSASGGTYYGECPRPAREAAVPVPLSPYGVSKLASEHYLRAYRSLHGLDYTVLRYGNVYGPRQDPHGEAGVVAIFCQRLLAGEPLWIFGDGRQKRDYVFVEDVARASVAALRRGGGEAINIGTGRAVSVNELARALARVHGGRPRVQHKPARPGELFQSRMDVRKARRVLGWRAEVELAEGLARTHRHIARAAGGRRPAVFLDRDGTLNVEKEYLHKHRDWVWIPGVIPALRALQRGGYRLVVVTNQSGVARGYYGKSDVDALHRRVSADLRRRGVTLDGIYVCPHGPAAGCECRKPEPGMLLRAARELGLDLASSFMIGDKAADVLAARRAGVSPLFVRTGHGGSEEKRLPAGVRRFESLGDAARVVLARGAVR
jgi:UDP-glucose 4-epimerase